MMFCTSGHQPHTILIDQLACCLCCQLSQMLLKTTVPIVCHFRIPIFFCLCQSTPSLTLHQGYSSTSGCERISIEMSGAGVGSDPGTFIQILHTHTYFLHAYLFS